MKVIKQWIVIVAVTPPMAWATGIFNIDLTPMPAQAPLNPPQPHSRQPQNPPVTLPALQPQAALQQSAPPASHPVKPAASVIPPVKMRPEMTVQSEQYQRYPNESDDVYLARMKSIYQRSVSETERMNQENLAKIKALAPPK